MAFEAGLLSYAGWFSLMLAMNKHRAALPLPRRPAPVFLRVVGCLLLILALVLAIGRLGAGYGIMTWLMQCSVAAALLVLLMSWRPSLAGCIALAAIAVVVVL
ncbi:DUF3325 family protein [Sphingobium bisphenolivorans]|uniref:DUF3325 family protein n=1 Tax=Sphingobium bisphenolivorans TaxID=1335760 RepID=UPI0003A04FA6|nr:DUF3325 family protein [Sphingobium bisphenolivorans]